MNITDKSNFIKEFEQKIDLYDSIVIVGHLSPDPDCMGSILLMKKVLKEVYNRNARCVLTHRYSNRLRFMDPNGDIEFVALHEVAKENTLVILVDTQDSKRADKFYVNNKAKFQIIRIDHHHLEDDLINALEYVKDASSTCELILDLWDINFEGVACAVLAGIIDDTGSLTYGTVASTTVTYVAKCIEYGASYEDVNYKLHFIDMKSFDLVTKFINNRIVVDDIAIFYITEDEAFEYSVDQVGEARDFITKKIKMYLGGINYVIIIKPQKSTRLHCRARFMGLNGKYDARDLAIMYGGGGHPGASGGNFNGKVVDFVDDILRKLGKTIVN